MGNPVDCRVIGHLDAGAFGALSRAMAEQWRRENMERYAAEFRRNNAGHEEATFSVEYNPNVAGFELKVCKPGVDGRSESSYENRLLSMQAAQQQGLSYIHSQLAAQQNTSFVGTAFPQVAAHFASMAKEKQRSDATIELVAKRLVRLGLKLKIWVYASLSGVSPFQMYRQLLKQERDNG